MGSVCTGWVSCLTGLLAMSGRLSLELQIQVEVQGPAQWREKCTIWQTGHGMGICLVWSVLLECGMACFGLAWLGLWYTAAEEHEVTRIAAGSPVPEKSLRPPAFAFWACMKLPQQKFFAIPISDMLELEMEL